MTPRKAYDDQVRHAESRGIPWLFTYETWLEMWLLSGRWESRGRKAGQYCMCRYHDQGSYSPRNCFIDLTDNNQQTRWAYKRKLLKEDQRKLVDTWLNSELSQAQVAEMFSVDQSYVSKLVKKVKNEQLPRQ